MSTFVFVLRAALCGGLAPVVRVLDRPTAGELEWCSAAMVRGFWTTPGVLAGLTEAQVAALGETQLRDLAAKFGTSGRRRRLRGSLLAIVESEAVVGLASVEVGLFDGRRPAILPRDAAEERFVEALGALDAGDRDRYHGSSVPEIAEALFDDGVRAVPLVANLAVLPERRRRGLGDRLVDACADLAKDWGFDELVLEVEGQNRPAVALYERRGFQELWRETRTALKVDASVPVADGPPLSRRPNVDHVAMRWPL